MLHVPLNRIIFLVFYDMDLKIFKPLYTLSYLSLIICELIMIKMIQSIYRRRKKDQSQEWLKMLKKRFVHTKITCALLTVLTVGLILPGSAAIVRDWYEDDVYSSSTLLRC